MDQGGYDILLSKHVLPFISLTDYQLIIICMKDF